MSKRFFENKILIVVPLAALIYQLCFLSNNIYKLLNVVFMAILIGVFLALQSKTKKVESLFSENENLSQIVKKTFKYCPDAIFIKDINSKYVACNNSLLKILNFSSEKEFLNTSDYDYFPEEKAKQLAEIDQKIIKNNETYEDEINFNGRIMQVKEAPLKKDSGEIFGIIGIIRDVTGDRDYKKKLEIEQDFFLSIFKNLPFLAYLRDYDGTVIYKNRYLDEFFAENVVGFTSEMFDKFLEEHREKFHKQDEEITKTHQPISFQQKYILDGQVYYFYIHKIPIFQGEKLDKLLIIVKDITSDIKIEHQKETFVATLTHDLKTPTIAQIKALEYFISSKNNSLNLEEKELLTEVHNSCKYMYKMIDNLNSTYKYNNGKFELHFESFDLIELIDECLAETKYLYVENNQEIRLEFNTPKCNIIADRLEVKRVIINLFSNAITYSYKNSVIRIAVNETNTSTTFLIINKCKNIQENELETFFDKYVSIANKYQKTSSGLGLYLSKQIIAEHQGKIFAKNKDDEYIFGFELFKEKMAEISLKTNTRKV